MASVLISAEKAKLRGEWRPKFDRHEICPVPKHRPYADSAFVGNLNSKAKVVLSGNKSKNLQLDSNSD